MLLKMKSLITQKNTTLNTFFDQSTLIRRTIQEIKLDINVIPYLIKDNSAFLTNSNRIQQKSF